MSSRFKPKWFPPLRSIRARLALWYGGILGAVFAFLGILFYFNLAQNLNADFNHSLQLTAEVVARYSLERRALSLPLNAEDFFREINDPELFNDFFRIVDSSGNVQIRSKNHPKRTVPLTPEVLNDALRGKTAFETFSYPGRNAIRLMTYPIIKEGKLISVLQVGGSLQPVDEVLSRLRFTLFLVLPAALILALVGGWFLAHEALQPVDAMAQVARQISAGDLSRRVPVRPRQDELSQLAETFNIMIGQLEGSIQQIRQFSADASHELRTPLTILKGEAEIALRQAQTAEEFRQTLVSSLEEVERMSRIVEDLFLLSKGDLGEERLEREPVELASLMKDTVLQLERSAKDKKVSLALVRDDESTVIGDIHRLRELFLNLIENAIRYTEAGGKVVLSVFRDRKEAVIIVSDTGIGISEEDLPRIFDRFYRAENARAAHPKGSGLGLSICQWIVLSHQGEIDVKSEPGRGTLFTIRFPLLT